MNTIFKIYFTHPETNSPQSLDCTNLTEALSITENLRNKGMSFVTMVSESSDMVGKAGVTGVKDGKLPNGEDYTYRKGDALSQRTKVYAPIGTDNIEVPIDEFMTIGLAISDEE